MIASDIKFVFTIALKKELPKEVLASCNFPVHTLAAVKSGSLKKQTNLQTGVLVLVTGAGLKASNEAACWIRDNINPCFVINIGTSGLITRKHNTGQWILPQSVSDENANKLKLDTRLPVPYPERLLTVQSLVSVKKSVLNCFANSSQMHDAVDMECYSQAQIFDETRTSFHCLKFGTDYADSETPVDFNRNLNIFKQEMEKLFNSLNQAERQPQISVVVPVYNRSNFIKQALDSITSQSHAPDEIIVVDDGSTDETREQLKSYGDSITTIFLEHNSGPSKARNAGVRQANTDWIAFLDSDDCWKKDKLKNQIEFIKKYPFYQILQSDEIWIRNGRRVNPCRHHAKPADWIWDASLERCLVSPSGVLIRKSLFEQFGGFDESLPVCEDYDLWLKISRHHPVGLEPSLSVVKYGGHSDQLSRKFTAMDSFRVQSLNGLLNYETDPAFRQKIITVLEEKMKILINGYEKRGKVTKAKYCRDIMLSIDK
jgi:GT2 family glycosyltransferase